MGLIEVKISTGDPAWPLLRQTPNGSGIWGKHRFTVDREITECDYWIVFGAIHESDRSRCAPENVILFTTEPESITKYAKGFLSQFSKVVTCQRRLKHPNLVFSQQCLPWHVGRRQAEHENLGFTLNYDELKRIQPEKNKLLSVISSSKNFTAGHQQRLRFVEHLRAAFGDSLDVFGRGIREIPDKWNAIAPYKYHIAIENSTFADYWTEKLSDTFLGWAYPLYYGCPNIYDYFPKESLSVIDIANPSRAIDAIKDCIQKNTYDRSLAAIRKAREDVLDRYNLFPTLAALCSEATAKSHKSNVQIRPERAFWSVWQRSRFHVLGPMKQIIRDSIPRRRVEMGSGQ